jgi:N-acetylneuraminic acid mutarotase
VDGKIYAIGGLQAVGWLFLSTVEEYDPATDRWAKKADMPTKRNFLSTSVVSGKIYAIGGFITWRKSGKALSVVEVYDPTTDTWTKGAEMPTPRWVPATSALKGKIYAIGGTTVTRGKWTTVSEVEVYNPATNRWTKGAEMPTQRGWHATSVSNGKIYVIGGASRGTPVAQPTGILSTVEEFDTGFAINAKGKLPTLWGRLKVWDNSTPGK